MKKEAGMIYYSLGHACNVSEDPWRADLELMGQYYILGFKCSLMSDLAAKLVMRSGASFNFDTNFVTYEIHCLRQGLIRF
jgi:hypothetical protein